jgi:hypothetical protein
MLIPKLAATGETDANVMIVSAPEGGSATTTAVQGADMKNITSKSFVTDGEKFILLISSLATAASEEVIGNQFMP